MWVIIELYLTHVSLRIQCPRDEDVKVHGPYATKELADIAWERNLHKFNGICLIQEVKELK